MKRIARLAVSIGIGSFFCLLVVGLFVFQTSIVRALDPVDELQNQINELENLKNLSVAATKPLEKEVVTLQARINSARSGIEKAKQEVQRVGDDIEEREVELALQYKILSKRVHDQYIRCCQ